MADDWTPMRNDLKDDPAVVTIALALNLDPDTVVGKLLRVWAWAGDHTVTGKCAGVTLAHVDHAAGHKDFGSAMRSAEWLEVDDRGSVTFPRWVRWNGKAAKKRLQDAKRASRYRVTQSSRKDATKSAPTEQNRTARRNPPKPPQGGASFSKRRRGEQVSDDRLKEIAAQYGKPAGVKP